MFEQVIIYEICDVTLVDLMHYFILINKYSANHAIKKMGFRVSHTSHPSKVLGYHLKGPCAMVVTVQHEIYVIQHDTDKCSLKQFDRMVPFEWENEASMWQFFIVVFNIFPTEVT